MKKIKYYLSILIALCSLVVSSCTFSSDITEIRVASLPKTIYYVGEKVENIEQLINVQVKQGGWKDLSDITNLSVIGFSTSTVGEHTATVIYSTNGKTFKAYFNYKVIANTGFAGGNGTIEYPYQISTPAQWDLMGLTIYNNLKYGGHEKDEYLYFELINDIDFSQDPFEYHKYFYGELDGNGYKLLNVIGTDEPKSVSALSNKNASMFDYGYGIESRPSVIKNINIYYDTTNKHGNIISYVSGWITFENVKTFGTIRSTSSFISPFVLQLNDSTGLLSFINCENNTNIRATNGGVYGAAGFLASTQSEKMRVVFDKCVNNGYIQAKIAAGFVGYGSTTYVELNNNNTNNGIIIGLDRAYKTLYDKNNVLLDQGLGTAHVALLENNLNSLVEIPELTYSTELNTNKLDIPDLTFKKEVNVEKWEIVASLWINAGMYKDIKETFIQSNQPTQTQYLGNYPYLYDKLGNDKLNTTSPRNSLVENDTNVMYEISEGVYELVDEGLIGDIKLYKDNDGNYYYNYNHYDGWNLKPTTYNKNNPEKPQAANPGLITIYAYDRYDALIGWTVIYKFNRLDGN